MAILGKGKVLIVEDDRGVATLERCCLERAGFTVATAETAAEAMVAVRAGGISLILLDHCLAEDANGLDFCTTLRELGLDIPVILVTGKSNEATAIQAIRANVRDYVTKSVDYLDYIPTAVDRVLRQVGIEQKQLVASEAQLDAIISSARDAILAVESDQRISLFNPAAERMFGCLATEAVGQPITQFIPQGLPKDILSESQGIRVGGESFPIEVSVATTEQLDRKHFTLLVRDITERKQAEESLRLSQAWYHSLVENLPVSLIRKDLAGRFTFANQQLCNLLGKPFDEIIGKTDFDFFPAELAEAYRRDDERVIAAGEQLNQEERNQMPGGEIRHVQVIKVPIRDHSGQVIGLQAMFWDITDRKQAEAALREQTEMLNTLNEVGKVLSAELDLNKLVQAVSDAGTRLSGAQFGAFFFNVLDQKGEAYLLHAVSGAPREAFASFPMPRNTDLFRSTFEGTRNIRLEDVTQDPRYGHNALYYGMPLGHLPVRSYLAVPVMSRSGKVLGGLFFGHTEIGIFHERAERLVSGLASTAAVAMDNSQLFQAAHLELVERRRVEGELRESEKRYAGLVNNIDGIVWELDAQTFQFRFVSPQAERILGHSVSRWLSEPEFWSNHLHPEDRERAVCYCLDNTRRGIDHHIEYRMLAADGREVWLHDVVSVETSDGKPVTLRGVMVDITERKRAEEERRKLEAQVQHAQKLESLGVLAGGIAHDFNNLLTSILGFAGLALLQLPEESAANPMIREIERASQRAAELTQQMLAYSGRGAFVIQALRLDSLVRDMTKLLETVVSKKAILDLSLEPATIEGDVAQIRQVVMNLITNASDAMEGRSGVISVRAGVRQADTAFLRSPILPDDLPAGAYVYFEVEDTGCGMTKEIQGRIFDPFFSTKFTGRGLGLAAVLGIIKGHRGTIKVESTPGRGTIFQVLFPYFAGIPAESQASVPKKPPRKVRGTVLVVEDEPSVRRFACRVLEGAGFQVRDAGDGREGLNLYLQHRQEIDAVLLDVTMPRMDGMEVLEELRRIPTDVPVVVMSGYSKEEISMRFLGLGASGFIQKPFHPRDLIASICLHLPADEDPSCQ